MSKYTVIEGADITIADIDEARKLDMLVYEDEYIVTLHQCIEWTKKNNRIYTMVRDTETDRIIAYVNISPVTVEYYTKISSGEFVDSLLPADAIVDYAFPDLYDLYFSSIVVHPDYQNTSVFLVIFNAIVEKFITLGKEGIIVRRMIADVVTDRGEKFCEMFGMTKRKISSHESEIYEISMLPPSFNVTSRATKELFKLYDEQAKVLGFGLKKKQEFGQLKKELVEKTAVKFDENQKVFISYSSKQVDEANKVCEFLEQNGVACWIAPRNINPGEPYASQIVQAIRGCAALVLLASNSTNASGHVSNEVSLAFDSKKKIIPFKIENVVFSDEYSYFLGRTHWIEAHLNMREGLYQLLNSLKDVLPTENNVVELVNPKPFIPVLDNDDFNEDELPDEPNIDVNIEPETTTKEYTREEIVEYVLKQAVKYSRRGVSRFSSSDDYTKVKEDANSFLQMSFDVFKTGQQVDCSDHIGTLVKSITDNHANLIEISGLPGSGKSVLLQASFYELLMEFKAGKTDYIPYYISLGYFEDEDYSGSSTMDQAKARMAEETAEFCSFIKDNQNVIPIVFVNEIREHNIGKVLFENALFDVMKANGIQKRVLTIDKGLIREKSKIKRVIPIATGRTDILFKSHMVDAHDEKDALYFIDKITSFYNCKVNDQKLFSILKGFKYHELDAFIIRNIAEELISSPNPVTNLSDTYEKWALTDLYGDEEKLFTASKQTFEYIYDEDFQISSVHFNDVFWDLIHQHKTNIDFLIAYYIIKSIDMSEGPEDFDCSLFGIALTASTNLFIGAFLREDFQLQSKVFKIITANYDSFSVIQKSSANFWLALITYKNLLGEAIAFLRPIFNEMHPVVKKQDRATQENYERQFLFRSVCIALVNFGQTSILDEYLCLIITNDSANAINRGAIVEYFGEYYEMAPNGTYCLDTDIHTGERAIKALSWKINKVLLPGAAKFPEMDLMTLTTLLQKRIQSNESRTLPEMNGWIEETLEALKIYSRRPQHIHSEKIEFYFKSIMDDFEGFLKSEGYFDISQRMYNELRGLKDVKRKQWCERNVEDPESVSEHSYSAWMLAMLFLPEELNHEGYLKHEVMDMLLIHDMAEAVLGDQMIDLNEPAAVLTEHNAVMRKLMVKGTYPNVANLTYFYNIWTGYFNGININSKIARDINLIQSVYTFCEYCVKYPDHFSEDDKKRWMNEKGKIETDIGYIIYDKLVENNYDFAGLIGGTDLLEHAIQNQI